MSAPRACVCSSCPAHPAGVSVPPACGFYPSSSLTDAQMRAFPSRLRRPVSGDAGARSTALDIVE